MEVLQKLKALVQASKEGELALERVLSEEEVKDSHITALIALPVGIRHGDLVQI